MKSTSAALLLVLALLPACATTGLAEDPDRATIIYQGHSEGPPGRVISRIVLTTEGGSPHLKEKGPGVLTREVPPDDMRRMLSALLEAGLGDLPGADGSDDTAPASIRIESGGTSRTWLGRLDRLGGEVEGVMTFVKIRNMIIRWGSALRVESRTR